MTSLAVNGQLEVPLPPLLDQNVVMSQQLPDPRVTCFTVDNGTIVPVRNAARQEDVWYSSANS